MNASRLAFVIDEPFIPDVYGGGVADIHEIARACGDHGWEAEVHCLRSSRPRFATGLATRFVRRLPFPYARTEHDATLGYPVHRRSTVSLLGPAPLPGRDAHIVVLQGARIPQLAVRYADLGLRVVLRVVTTASVDEIDAYSRVHASLRSHLQTGSVAVVANSRFVADRAEDQLGVKVAWSYPPIASGNGSRAAGAHGDSVLFVNPVELKGLETALNVARLMPDTNFLFQESWPLAGRERGILQNQLSQLPNVELRGNVPRLDAVFHEAGLLLVPSVVDEAFGRVIVEANRFGIPVVASRAGGIPEAIRSAGLLVERDAPAEMWVKAIRTVMSERGKWTERAFSNGASPDFSLDEVVGSFVALMSALRPRK
ncbi:glycosyltransferase [Sinomonas sp. RB5]